MEILIIVIAILIIVFVFILQQKKEKKMEANLQEWQVELTKQQALMAQFNGMIKEQTLENQRKQDDILLKSEKAETLINGIGNSFQTLLEQINRVENKNTKTDTIVSDISSKISSMNDIMVNKKARGNWGEYQLNSLLSLYAGDNREVFQVQYQLKNGYIGDAALFLPGTEKVLMIDSKFPMENYQNIIYAENDFEVQKYEKLFQANIKKHVNDIAKKYITSETTEQAVMFIPSEAIFTYLCAEQSEMIDYAQRKHILITSPTTLIGVVFTLVNITKDFNRSKNMKEIEKQIVSLAEDASRLVERIESTENNLNTTLKNLTLSKTSATKMHKAIHKVADGYIDEEKEENE